MRGHIHKRGTTWTAVYDEGHGENGRRRQRSKGGFQTRRDAQRFLTDVLARLGDGSYAQPSKVTLGEFLLEEWLPAVEATVRPGTFAHYRSVVRTHVVPRVGHRRLQGLTGGVLNGFYRELEQAGLAPGTRRQVHAVLHHALHDAVRWGNLVRNPAAQADPPKGGSPRASAWTDAELRRFLTVTGNDRLRGLWRLAAVTGMRRGELLGLAWRSLDLEAGTLTVDRQLRADNQYGQPKSRRSCRTVALDPQTVRLLEAHRQAQLVEQALAGDVYQDEDLVFCDELGRPVHPQRLSRLFLVHRKAAGIPTGSLHTLRHTAATLMLTNGVPLHVAAARLGDDPRTVLDRYAHLLPQADRDAADRVAALLAG
jgi:integrase